MSRRRIRVVGLAALVMTLAPAAMPRLQATGERYVSTVFEDHTVTSDVVYGGAVNDTGVFEVLELDVYEPVGDEHPERPAFVWAHGGSMITGDKAGGIERQLGEAFAERGWVFVSINYRLMSQFVPDCPNDLVCALSPRLPLALIDGQHDMQAAVRFMRKHAATYRINPDEITVGGHSAGTALALRTAFNPQDPGTSGNPGYPSHVAGVMTNSGTLLEPSSVGPGEPPIVMFNAVDDADLTLWVALLTTCIPTTLVGNVCELHAFPDGGHSLSIHRQEIIQKTSEFFCRRVIAECDIGVPEASSYVGPSGSQWDGDVHCGTSPEALLNDPITVFAGPTGVELCTGDAPLPLRGYVDLDDDGTLDYLQVDGAGGNPLLHSSLHVPADPVVLATELLDMIVDSAGGVVPLG